MVHSNDPSSPQSPGTGGDSRPRKSLADVMESVRRAPSLPEHRRRVLLSALRTVCRCLGKAPSEVSAQPAVLQKELDKVNFLQCGLSKKRWTNVRSLTLAALRIAGAQIMPSRWLHSVYSPAWYALRLACRSKYHLAGLSKFMNDCSSLGIEPDAVDAGTFESFRARLQDSLVRNSASVFKATCRLWDSADRVIDGWPAFKIKLAPLPRGYSLDWSTFPQSLKDDVDAFLEFGGNRDITSDEYAPSVKAATTDGRRKALRQMSTALAASGKPISEITSLSVLVEPENARCILRFFIGRAEGKATESISSSM